MSSQEDYYNPITIEDTNANYYNENQESCTKNPTNSSILRGNDTILDEIDEPLPVIYIDMPHNENRIENPRLPTNIQNGSQQQNYDQTTIDIEDANQNGGHRNKVIYINPHNTQNTRQTIQNEPPTPNPVEQTIFYDPFEDRRIVMANPTEVPRPVRTAPLPPNTQTEVQKPIRGIPNEETRPVQPTEANVTSHRPIDQPRRFSQIRPVPEYQRTQRPSDLHMTLQEHQRNYPEFNRTFQRPTERLTAHSPLTADDGFTLTPLPITEYPEPPPSYQEVILTTQQGNFNSNSYVVTQQPTSAREVTVSTQDLLQNDQQPSLSSTRKTMTCHHCNTRVTTVVLKQNGCATHVIAMLFLFFCLFPITILIYCMGCLKYENHYCPTCSSMIGYRVPILGQQLVHVSPR